VIGLANEVAKRGAEMKTKGAPGENPDRKPVAGAAAKPVQKSLLITHREAGAMIGADSRLLLRCVKTGAGGFPKPVRVVERTYLFRRAEIEKWGRV
jgi:predicted DNA-binding transcriptional regulator AlpA